MKTPNLFSTDMLYWTEMDATGKSLQGQGKRENSGGRQMFQPEIRLKISVYPKIISEIRQLHGHMLASGCDPRSDGSMEETLKKHPTIRSQRRSF